MGPEAQAEVHITNSLFVPGQCSDRQVDLTCSRPLCCVHQRRRYCISMYCESDHHTIRHDHQTVNICLDQAEQDDDLTTERHRQHMRTWTDFCSSHPDIQHLCVNGLELKQSIQVVQLLLEHYQNSLTCLSLTPFCTPRLPLQNYTFTNLMYLTMERIDADCLAILLPKLENLRGICASRSNYDRYADLNDGVQFIVESHCNLQHVIFDPKAMPGWSAGQILAQAETLVLNGGPVASDDEMREARAHGERWVSDRDGIRLLGLENYVSYADSLREKTSTPKQEHHLLEMVSDDALHFLLMLTPQCRRLRIGNADFTPDALSCLSSFPHLTFVHISLYYGGPEFALDVVYHFLARNFQQHAHFDKFELFGCLHMTPQQQHLFLRLNEQLVVYLYTHESCRWWRMDKLVPDTTLIMDGMCVYRRASTSLHLTHDFVNRAQSATQSEEDEEEDVEVKVTVVTSVKPLDPDNDSDDNDSCSSLSSSAKTETSDISLSSEPPPRLRPARRAATFADDVIEREASQSDRTEGKDMDQTSKPKVDADDGREGLGAELVIEPFEDDAMGQEAMSENPESQSNISFLRRLVHGIRGLRCSCWNKPPKGAVD